VYDFLKETELPSYLELRSEHTMTNFHPASNTFAARYGGYSGGKAPEYNPIKAVAESLRSYGTAKGRASRSEYFWTWLMLGGFVFASWTLDTQILLTGLGFGPGTIVSVVVVSIPALSVTVRRLHDIGRSGSWTILKFVPVVNILMLLYLSVTDGEDESNEYG